MADDRLLLKNAVIVNPLQSSVFTGDLRVKGNVIEEVAENISEKNGDDVFDLSGKLLMPGLVDTHVHFSSCPDGHFMLAKAGVTSALDMAGNPDEIIGGFMKRGSGLTLAFLYPLIPGESISGTSPSEDELEKAIEYGLKNGALGIKIVGGHYPLGRDATRNAIRIARKKNCWIAVHAGTLETPGNIRGMEELVQLAEGNPLHVAHVNSYCRGTEGRSPLEEAQRAIDALKKAPNCHSESYLALINGTSGRLDENGIPKSEVTKRSLLHGGYTADAEGIKKAILSGWAKVNYHDQKKHEVVFPEPAEALDFYMKLNTDVRLSFPVNSPVSAIPIALAKDEKGKFIVDALSTDGGEIPRNITLKQGLCLVNFGAMTINELAYKASLAPARMLGLNDRGYIAEGGIADLIAVNPLTSQAELSIVEGQIIMRDGNVCGKGGNFLTTHNGKEFFSSKSIAGRTTEPDWLK
ncbi:MAG: hypothetical protein A2017_00175 [Lentisphaerae bacterium GWF2_44_16]|nr:MAG: hypothetical protein A2017_00175 [Lentisphaerae bacterium GWF2_44_16]